MGADGACWATDGAGTRFAGPAGLVCAFCGWVGCDATPIFLAAHACKSAAVMP